jgi:hypothetical protein
MSKKQLDANKPIKRSVQNEFISSIVHSNAIATSNDYKNDDFDLERAKHKSEMSLTALNIEGGLQAMLASQMLAINKLQHTCMTVANNLTQSETSHYYINMAIKLANTFVQQAALLAKLQGGVGQKIVVERVDISNGGQAVIGSVNTPNKN